MWLRAATLALIPALVIQGSRVKKNTIRLPEAEGAREGITGQGQTLSLLILGDSAAAGVGVAHQNDALLGAVISALQHQYQVHWRLDVGMREDECQIVRGEAGENLAVCRHIAMNLLTADKTFKAGIKRKQKRAGRNNEYLAQILTGCGSS